MKKLQTYLIKIEETICCTALSIVILSILINTLCGWILGKRLGHLEEVALTGFVWVTFFSLGLVYKKGSQISVDFLIELLPNILQKWANFFVALIVSLSSVYITYNAYILMIHAIDKKTPLSKISYFFIDLSAVLGFSLMCIYATIHMINQKNKLKNIEEKLWN